MCVCAFKGEWGVDEAAFSRSVWLGMAVGGGGGGQELRACVDLSGAGAQGMRRPVGRRKGAWVYG